MFANNRIYTMAYILPESGYCAMKNAYKLMKLLIKKRSTKT